MKGRGRGREDALAGGAGGRDGVWAFGDGKGLYEDGAWKEKGRVGCGGVAIVVWVSERGIGTDAGVWCVGKSGVGGGYLAKGVWGVRVVSVGMMGDAELVAKKGGFGEQGRITGKVVPRMGSQYFLYSSVWVGLLVQGCTTFPFAFSLLSFLRNKGGGSQSWDLCHRTMVLGLLRKRGMNVMRTVKLKETTKGDINTV